MPVNGFAARRGKMSTKLPFSLVRLMPVLIGLSITPPVLSGERFSEAEITDMREWEGKVLNLAGPSSPGQVFVFRAIQFRLPEVKSPGTAMVCNVYPSDAWVFVREFRKDPAGADVIDFRAFELNKEEGQVKAEVKFQKRFAAVHQILRLSKSKTGKQCGQFIAREPGKTDWGIGAADPMGIHFEYKPGRIVDYADALDMEAGWNLSLSGDLPKEARVFLVQSGMTNDWTGPEWYPWFTNGFPERYYYFFHLVCSRYHPEPIAGDEYDDEEFCDDLYDTVEQKLDSEEQDLLDRARNLLAGGTGQARSEDPHENKGGYDSISVPEWRKACRDLKIPFPECSAAENGVRNSLYKP
jgi:hypothetical protein